MISTTETIPKIFSTFNPKFVLVAITFFSTYLRTSFVDPLVLGIEVGS